MIITGKNKNDKTGEKKVNNFGSEMIIIKYRKAIDIDVYFPEYNWTYKGAQYTAFKNGKIKCPYERRVYGVGYFGEGEYKVYDKNGKITRVYKTWHSMLTRCYDERYYKRNPTYTNCKVCDEWHNFQNFAKWYYDNYYEVEGERMCLDKDILIKHNKIYSPETCIFVPEKINVLFTKRQNDRGNNPIGTSLYKNGKYQVHCHLLNPKTGKSKNKYLGRYDTELEAFEVYKYYKEKNIKEVADYFKKEIPNKLYDALYNYIVEITD